MRFDDTDIEMIRQAIDECMPDLAPVSTRYQKRRAGFRRATPLEVHVRGERLARELNARHELVLRGRKAI